MCLFYSFIIRFLYFTINTKKILIFVWIYQIYHYLCVINNKDMDMKIPKFEDLNPKLQGFITGVGISLLSVFTLGTYLVYFK